jgi:hypothetical protein
MLMTCCSSFSDEGSKHRGLRATSPAPVAAEILFLALLRIKRPEALKEHTPPCAPRARTPARPRPRAEVKTLPRKLARMAALGYATELGRQLAEHRVQRFSDAMGLLYVDGQPPAANVRRAERRHPKLRSATMKCWRKGESMAGDRGVQLGRRRARTLRSVRW